MSDESLQEAYGPQPQYRSVEWTTDEIIRDVYCSPAASRRSSSNRFSVPRWVSGIISFAIASGVSLVVFA